MSDTTLSEIETEIIQLFNELAPDVQEEILETLTAIVGGDDEA